MNLKSALKPFSCADEDQRSLLDHFIVYRLRMDDIARLMDIWKLCLDESTALPAPTISGDKDWRSIATVVSNVFAGYVTSLFDSDTHSLDCRQLLPMLFPEETKAIDRFFQDHKSAIESQKRFRNKAIAHSDRRLATLLQAHSRSNSGNFGTSTKFLFDSIKLTDRLEKQEQTMISRFTIDVKQHITERAESAGALPSRIHQLLVRFGLGGN